MGGQEQGGCVRRIWNSAGLWRLATLVALVAIAVMFAAAPFGVSGTPSSTFLAVLQPQPGVTSGGWLVEIGPDRSVRLTPLGRTEVPADRSLQLWTLVDQAEGPKSVGILKPDDVSLFQPDAVATVGPDQLFEISVEPPTGSPTGRPTGPVLFKGTTKEALR